MVDSPVQPGHLRKIRVMIDVSDDMASSPAVAFKQHLFRIMRQ